MNVYELDTGENRRQERENGRNVSVQSNNARVEYRTTKTGEGMGRREGMASERSGRRTCGQ